MEICSEYENVISGRECKLKIKELEYKSLCGLVDALGNNQLELSDVDGFHFSFRINQISKEFDLLKVKGDERVLNIELKSEMIEEDRIKKQLEQNQYYLKHIAKKIDSFTYVDGINQFFKLDEGELVKCCVSDLIQVLKDFKNYDDQIEQLFQVKNYLISPLNTPQKFLNGQYFLTGAQKKIKEKIISDAKKENHKNFWGIAGKAGTGKTLLLYDLAKDLCKQGRVCVIHCGVLCEGHMLLREKIDNIDIIDAKSVNTTEFDEYDYILVDETQRIYKSNMEVIGEAVRKNNQIAVFSYDGFQTLSRKEEDAKIAEKIEELAGKSEELTNKIRTNQEMASFVTSLFNLNNRSDKLYKYDKVDIVYANSIEEAKKIIRYYRKDKGYVFIEYTKSLYSPGEIDKYHGDINTHRVIGQEYDNVLIVMDDNFYYNSGRLCARKHPYDNYLFYKLFFQGISRVRDKLCIVVVNNVELLKNILSIKCNTMQ